MQRLIFCFILGLCFSAPLNAQTSGNAAAHWFGHGFEPAAAAPGGGFIGTLIQDVDAALAEELNLPEERGAALVRVLPDTPAEAAGLQDNDVVTGWNGTRVESARQFSRMVKETPPGRTVHLQIVRNGAPTTLDVDIGGQTDMGMHPPFGWVPDPDAQPWAQPPAAPPLPLPGPDLLGRGAPAPSEPPKLGIRMAPLTDELSAYFGLEDRTGVLITSVMSGSAADLADLKAGDVIIAVDKRDVASLADVQDSVRMAAGLTDITIVRDRQQRIVEVNFEASTAETDDTQAEQRAASDSPQTDPKFPRSSM